MIGKRTINALLAGLALTSSVAAWADDQVLPALRDVGIDQRLDQTLPLHLNFQDEHGRTVQLGEYFRERPVVLSLVYYECPMLCTLVLNGLVSAMRAISLEPGRDFDIVTVSFDPREKPPLALAKKEKYLEEYRRTGAKDAWHFLTGDEESIKQLAESVGFRYRFDPKLGQFAHAAGIVVLTPGGKIARYLFGVEYAPRDLRLGLVEAARGQIGTVVDQLMLYCYQYDATMGRYTPMVLNLVRAGALVTILSLLALFFWLRKRDPNSTDAGSGIAVGAIESRVGR